MRNNVIYFLLPIFSSVVGQRLGEIVYIAGQERRWLH